MDDKDLEHFVVSYGQDDTAISFNWDGKDDEDFVDQNAEFRSAVVDYVISHTDHVPLKLMMDLYRALTEQSVQSWSIDARVEDLGKLMLTGGGSAVARDYLIGAMQSFDAQCGTSFVGCPKGVAEDCLALARARLQSETDEDELAIWEFGVERFGVLLEHAD